MGLTGCSMVKEIWGEAPPKRKVVEIKGSELPPIEKLFSKDDVEAEATYAAWRANITSSFSQI